MKTSVSSAAHRSPIPLGFCKIGSTGDSPLVITLIAGTFSVFDPCTSATITSHGDSVRASGDRGFPPLPGWRKKAILRPSIDQTGCESRDVDGAMKRIG